MLRIPRPRRPMSRRTLLHGALLAAAGAVTGAAAATEIPRLCGWDRPPLRGGYASAADRPDRVNHPHVTVDYYVETTEPVVAFTFDDGPGPRWTPMVLDALEASDVPATFFMVGSNLTAHADIVRGRLDRHEVGNHSWSHDDLATLDLAGATDDLTRTHEAIQRFTGRTPTLMRPPYGHLGGSTLLAADTLGYDITLWSHLMHERQYLGDPPAQVRDLVDNVRPGAIILAHDVGRDERLVALRQLTEMFRQLRDRGFRFATVSELRSLATTSSAGPEAH